MKDSNIGLTGVESIRIDGLEIGNIPLGQGNEAKAGLAAFLKTAKESERNDILAKFPKHKVETLQGQLRECQHNIKKIKQFKADLKAQIADYRQHIRDCATRETEMAKFDPNNEAHKPILKKLRLRYPPYNVEALNQQIVQFEEAIERCDATIEQDYESISEIQALLALVEQRERELRNV